MKRVVIVSACRTAIGAMGGALSHTPVAELGAIVIKEAVSRAGVCANQIDHVYMGCVLQTGQGQNVARQAAIKAGLAEETPAVTINAVCGSGLDSVNQAAYMICAGEADTVVAGGMENMSRAPYALTKARYGYRLGHETMLDTMMQDGLWDAFHGYHMGITAENLAQEFSILRKEMDAYALESQRKACAAIAAGAFSDEIVSVPIVVKKEMISFCIDESPRTNVTIDRLARLQPVFRTADGVVTAGNASPINDGAAALVLMSEEKAIALGITPMATFVGGTLAGVAPAYMGLGPVASTEKLFAKTGLSMNEIDLVECNEAFAVQAITVCKLLGIAPDQLNVNGGAIALGHPLGASGARILVTLLYAMRQRGATRGLATLCVGGGMGCSSIVSMKRNRKTVGC